MIRIAAVATCAGALFCGSAQASETVGSTFFQSPNAGFIAPLTMVQHVQPADNPTPYPLSPTTAGVVTEIRFKHAGTDSSPGTAGIRVIGTDFNNSIASRSLTASVPVEASNFAWPPSLPAGIFTFTPTAGGLGAIPKGFPITASQRVGYAQLTGPLPWIAQYHGFDGHNWTTLITDPNIDHTSGSADYRIVFDNVELLIQYTVEPDADSDGYGDDTQDACPADNSTRIDCAAAIPSLTGTDPASPANNNAPKIKGNAFAGSAVKLYTASDCTGSPIASGTAEQLAGAGIPIPAVSDDTSTTVYASMTIPSGTSDCSAGVAYEEVTPPGAPDITGVTPASGSDDNQPKLTGSAEPGTTVELYKTADCSGAPAASGTQAAFASTGIAVTVGDNSTTFFRAKATDASGTSGCSSSSVRYAEVTPPPPIPAMSQKCKKGQKLKQGKCVKKKRKKRK